MAVEYTCVERPTHNGWELVGHTSTRSVYVTQANFIFDQLLPTFATKGNQLLDPQFLIDFKRAKPHPEWSDRAATWSINGQPAPREPSVLLSILGCQKPLKRLRITQLYNQRCGIDICRRVQGLYDEHHVVLPKSSTYTLDLELMPGKPNRIHACADMSVFEYDERGVTGRSVSRVSVDATYDLYDGTVCYNVVRR